MQIGEPQETYWIVPEPEPVPEPIQEPVPEPIEEPVPEKIPAGRFRPESSFGG